LLDLVFWYFTKTRVSYFYIEDNFWISLLRFFDPTYNIPELPRSVRLEIAVVTLMASVYIAIKRKKVLPTVLGALSVYFLCFLYVSVPAVLIEIVKLLVAGINTLHLKIILLPEGIISENIVVLLELLLTALLSLVWLWRWNKPKAKAILKNMRLTRSAHYMLLCLVGIAVYCLDTPIKDIFSLIPIFGTLAAIFFAFQFSVVVNDIFDTECDRISNAQRPLVRGVLDQGEYLRIGLVFLAFSLLFSYWVNETSIMILLLFIAFYFLYSAPPFRLKRFWPLSCLIIGVEALLAFIMGEASLAAGEEALRFHAFFFLPILAIFTLASNIKDLKDIEGDRCAGVATLPVLFGERTGRIIIASLVAVSYCLVPYFLRSIFPQAKVTVLSACFAVVSFLYLLKKSSREWILFLIYFIYAGILLLTVR
jgi:4-hydroxybenzoate polyprenyltransferase